MTTDEIRKAIVPKKELKKRDGTITPAGFNEGLQEVFAWPNDKERGYLLQKNLTTRLYLLTVFERGEEFQRENKHIGKIREFIITLKKRWKREDFAATLPVKRAKLYRIVIGTRGNMKSVGFYRDVAHYIEENPNRHKRPMLKRSIQPTDWIYEDTGKQV